ncbi:hypothetical protein BJ508DRAFT_315274 [Ascobolus immersus RN42]|uniref:Uncharacterized protein n=1 Tax=Ascobolus immersus RN42 TaxID=1160509 RepID=A0A3N4HBG8_ASCIM|nr:hypothetical protein BJ508DRAFT_315274 [Ascobolus immersus RN42]
MPVEEVGQSLVEGHGDVGLRNDPAHTSSTSTANRQTTSLQQGYPNASAGYSAAVGLASRTQLPYDSNCADGTDIRSQHDPPSFNAFFQATAVMGELDSSFSANVAHAINNLNGGAVPGVGTPCQSSAYMSSTIVLGDDCSSYWLARHGKDVLGNDTTEVVCSLVRLASANISGSVVSYAIPSNNFDLYQPSGDNVKGPGGCKDERRFSRIQQTRLLVLCRCGSFSSLSNWISLHFDLDNPLRTGGERTARRSRACVEGAFLHKPIPRETEFSSRHLLCSYCGAFVAHALHHPHEASCRDPNTGRWLSILLQMNESVRFIVVGHKDHDPAMCTTPRADADCATTEPVGKIWLPNSDTERIDENLKDPNSQVLEPIRFAIRISPAIHFGDDLPDLLDLGTLTQAQAARVKVLCRCGTFLSLKNWLATHSGTSSSTGTVRKRCKDDAFVILEDGLTTSGGQPAPGVRYARCKACTIGYATVPSVPAGGTTPQTKMDRTKSIGYAVYEPGRSGY